MSYTGISTSFYGFDFASQKRLNPFFELGTHEFHDHNDFAGNELLLKLEDIDPNTAYFQDQADMLDLLPIEIVPYGRYGYKAIAVKGTVKRYSPANASPLVTELPTEEVLKLAKAYCTEKGIEWSEPQWLIVNEAE